jgi:hypothetical protein
MQSLRIYRATGLPVAPLPVPKSITAIVGYGIGTYIGEVRGPYQSLAECSAEMDNTALNILKYGHSAVYRWVKDFMAQGGRKIYVVEPTISAAQTITCTGTGTKREFDMITDKTGGAGVLTLSPVPGTVSVEYPFAVFLVEGTDYIIDYSNGVVKLKTAPPAVADNIRIIFKEYVAANLTAAFVKLENKDVAIVGGAYFASDNGNYSLVDTIDAHVDAAALLFRPRRAMWTGYYGDYSAAANKIGAKAQGYNNADLVAWANLSGYFNANLVDPSISWLEYKDPSAHHAGLAASRDPWKSMHEQVMNDLNQNSDWTSTQITALAGAYVNFDAWDGYGAYRSKNGWTCEVIGSQVYLFTDAKATWNYVHYKINSDFHAASIFGNVAVSRDEMMMVEQTILNSLTTVYKEGGVDNPKDLTASWPQYKPVMSILIDALRKDPSDRTVAERAYIQNVQNVTRTEDIRCYYDYMGSLHYINLYLGGL